MAPKPIGERMAAVETESDNQSSQIDKLTDAVNGISTQLHAIALELARNKGFMAGISFVFSMLGAGLVYLADHFWGRR